MPHPPSPALQACLDNLKRGFDHLNEKALGSSDVREYIPQPQLRALLERNKELKAQHALLDWTTAFPNVYKKKTMKNMYIQALLPHKCKSFEHATEKWKRDAERAAALADCIYQRVRKERMDRYRSEYKTSVFDRHLVQSSAPTLSSLSYFARSEARNSMESGQTQTPIDDVHPRFIAPWMATDSDNSSLAPSTDNASTLSDLKRTAPWLARRPSMGGKSLREGFDMAEPRPMRTRTKSTKSTFR